MKISFEQEQYIWLYHGDGKSYDDISRILGVTRQTLSQWEVELRPIWTKLAEIKRIHLTKEIKLPLKEFYEWYLKQEDNRKCAYCGITEDKIKVLLDGKMVETKRNRGRKLELDRKVPDLPYDETSNIVLACYWCNNAKTDTFTFEEFQRVGKVFAEIWKERLIK
jgi:hypothetical protein